MNHKRKNMNIIEITNLTKRKHKKDIYKNISLTVQKGDFYAIIGAGGEGKTSLLHSILGLRRYTDGQLLLFGQKHLSRFTRKKIGYVPDELLYFPRLTGAGLLDMTISLRKLPNAYDRAGELIDYFQISPGIPLCEMDEDANKCIYLISALLSEPELLILDEPFHFLTDSSASRLRELLGKYCKKENTVLITEDNYENIHPFCSRVSVLKDKVQIHRDLSPRQYSTQKLITVKNPSDDVQKRLKMLPETFPSQIRFLQSHSTESQFLFTGKAGKLNDLLTALKCVDYNVQDVTIHDQLLKTYDWMEE